MHEPVGVVLSARVAVALNLEEIADTSAVVTRHRVVHPYSRKLHLSHTVLGKECRLLRGRLQHMLRHKLDGCEKSGQSHGRAASHPPCDG